MDDKRNWITAILLSAAILLGWNFVAQKFFPTATKPDVTKTVAGSPTATTATPGAPAALPAPGAAPAGPAAQTIVPVETAVASANRVPIETPALAGSINLVGARIDDVTLTK